MMKKLMSVMLILAASLFLAATAAAQVRDEQPDLTIDAATRTQVIEAILKRLNDSYIFPEVAKKMETAIRERAQKKEYDQITSSAAFARKLTEDLQAGSHDKHLRVRYSHEAIPENQQRSEERRVGKECR